jgi:ribosomal protein S18 acetylase RimI-like enzyme
VRRARPEDAEAVADLLYESSSELYDRYAGGSGAARRLLAAAFRHPGTTSSAEVMTVAELDGEVAAVLAAFPVGEAERRARSFLRLSLRRLPPWRWPPALRLFRLGAEAAPPPPPRALYVDALATSSRFRRRGAARALLDAARERAVRLRLTSVALDTETANAPARALYDGAGFRVTGERPPAHGLPGYVGYVLPLH